MAKKKQKGKRQKACLSEASVEDLKTWESDVVGKLEAGIVASIKHWAWEIITSYPFLNNKKGGYAAGEYKWSCFGEVLWDLTNKVFEALPKFDPSRGNKLKTFMDTVIKNHHDDMYEAIKSSPAHSTVHGEHTASIVEDADQGHDQAEEKAFKLNDLNEPQNKKSVIKRKPKPRSCGKQLEEVRGRRPRRRERIKTRDYKIDQPVIFSKLTDRQRIICHYLSLPDKLGKQAIAGAVGISRPTLNSEITEIREVHKKSGYILSEMYR